MKSQYADRDTVGTIALDALKNPESIEVGDMARELMPKLVDDLNESIRSNPFEGRPFYITIHEKKDAQLTNVILRRMVVSEYRPYPEDNTTVFWTNPQTSETRFCWSLPHRVYFPSYLESAWKYPKDLIKDIIAYLKFRMDHFGFYKTSDNKYFPIPDFKDRPLHKKKTS